ncbi:sigma-70 family RNA polymerase sigma factor [uncultured Draconibacterium sp.]|uniref:sigma-70 family RNA polymerase sigma factor n=1 Tax=uncultured Draconibacterium sp. TaxID=1573823 RepID=UPI0029C71B8A|nr:sigma-70 family RNA polymerase sigma factor [uncultured Draconibacterium sp.]
MDKIVAKLRDGDEQAFVELFHAFWDAGQRFVRSFISNDDICEDITQEVFLQIWDKRQIFESEKHFKAYFYKSLRNNTIKHLSRQKPSEEISNILTLESDDLFAKIVEVEFKREISRAISMLPEKRKQVILHAMAGLTVEEIAKQLNISVNTVKIHKKKAYSDLRKELKNINLRILAIFM